MVLTRVLLRNIASHWLGYAVQIAVAFFLTPYIIQSLGETRYGIWTLAVGLTGYYGLLDLGFSAGMTQYLTRYLAVNDATNMNQTASTGFFVLSGCGLVVIFASLVVAMVAPSFFNIQLDLRREVSLVVVITGVSAGIQFLFFTHSAVFTAVQRFDLSNAIGIGTRAMSALATIFCLNQGYGLVGLSLVVACTNLVDYLVRWRVALHLLPELSISFQAVSRARLGEILRYGIWNVAIAGSVRLASYTDAVIIAAFMPVAAVTPFAIAVSLRTYFEEIFVRAGFVFFPAATELDAKGDLEGLRRLYLVSSRFMFLGSIVAGSLAICWANDFFHLWLGPALAQPDGYPSVASLFHLLMFGAIVAVAQRIGYQVLFGTRRVSLLAWLFIGEAVSNLLLSLILVRSHGLVGVALGTLIPALIFQGILQPLSVCRSLEIPLSRYGQEVLLKPALCVSLLAAAVAVVLTYGAPPASKWSALGFRFTASLLFAAGVVWIFGLDGPEKHGLFHFLNPRPALGRLRQVIRTRRRKFLFNRLVRRILAAPASQVPSRRLIEQLSAHWGNEAYSGHPNYLDRVIRSAIAADGPILECGSGLTTLLLGIYAGRRGIPVWTLEHDENWQGVTLQVLGDYNIPGVELVYAPLRDYGGYTWYQPPLDRMPAQFAVVVCDGPPKVSTQGDRYGLLPVMHDRFSAGTVILLDDIQSSGEDPVLSRWRGEASFSYEIFATSPSDSHAVLALE